MCCWIRISGHNFHLAHAFRWKSIFVNLRRLGLTVSRRKSNLKNSRDTYGNSLSYSKGMRCVPSGFPKPTAKKTDFGRFGYHLKQRNFVQVMVLRLFFQLLFKKTQKWETFWESEQMSREAIPWLSYELLILVIRRTRIGLMKGTTLSSYGTVTNLLLAETPE